MWSEADIWRWFSAAGDGCYVVDERCQIVLWDEMAQRLLGFSREEALQGYCYEVIKGQGEGGSPLCQPKCAIREAASRGIPLPSYYLLARRKDGKGLWLNVSLLLIPTPPAEVKYPPVGARTPLSPPGMPQFLLSCYQEKRAPLLPKERIQFIDALIQG